MAKEYGGHEQMVRMGRRRSSAWLPPSSRRGRTDTSAPLLAFTTSCTCQPFAFVTIGLYVALPAHAGWGWRGQWFTMARWQSCSACRGTGPDDERWRYGGIRRHRPGRRRNGHGDASLWGAGQRPPAAGAMVAGRGRSSSDCGISGADHRRSCRRGPGAPAVSRFGRFCLAVGVGSVSMLARRRAPRSRRSPSRSRGACTP